MIAIRPFAAASLVTLAACFQTHVTIPPPPPNLTGDQRVAAFQALEPVDQLFLEQSTDHGNTWTLASTTLLLANHTEVVSPEDLLPVVATTSETARAAHASATARRNRNISWLAMLATMAVGWELAVGFDATRPNVSREAAWSFLIVAPLVSYLFERHYQHEELDERRFAFAHYTRDLGDRLDVCASGYRVVPCEAPPPAQPVPPVPPSSPPGQTAPGTLRSVALALY